MPVVYGDIGNTWIQLGRETTYNLNAGTTTVTAATGRMNVIGCSLKATPSILDEMNLSSAANSPPVGTYTTTSYAGTLSTKANYEGTCIQRLLASAYGTHIKTVPASGHCHTYTEASTLPSLSLQQKLAGIPVAADLGVCYTGVIVQGFTFKCGAGIGKEGVGTFDFDLWSPNCNSNAATGITLNPAFASPPTTPGTVTDNPVMWKHALMTSVATMYDGSGVAPADIRMKSFEFKHTNNIDTGRYYIGSAAPDGARRSVYGEHTMTITAEFQTLDAFNLLKTYAAPTSAPKVLFQGAVVTGATYREMEFGLSATARLTDYTLDLSGYGIPTCTMTWRGHRGALVSAAALAPPTIPDGGGYVRVQNGIDVASDYIGA